MGNRKNAHTFEKICMEVRRILFEGKVPFCNEGRCLRRRMEDEGVIKHRRAETRHRVNRGSQLGVEKGRLRALVRYHLDRAETG
jgi:hypothetical protein